MDADECYLIVHAFGHQAWSKNVRQIPKQPWERSQGLCYGEWMAAGHTPKRYMAVFLATANNPGFILIFDRAVHNAGLAWK